MNLARKGMASFGTIVAVIGSILIALGVAWLIAQNWHWMPGLLKILILLGATSAAYTIGVKFRLAGYRGIGKALLVLGALLYTLSIFLIAQIFSTSTSAQGTAWLWLLSWAGVLAAAYIFESSASLIVALSELVIWLFIQYAAFAETSWRSALSATVLPPAFLAIYLLLTGVVLYGASLLHRSRGHGFARVYEAWTAFYFLGFAYVLSFQMLLPLLWPSGTYPLPALLFLAFLAVLALAALAFGTAVHLQSEFAEKKELFWVIGIVLLLLLLIGAVSLIPNPYGQCSQRECHSYRDAAPCQSAPAEMDCTWKENFCQERGCTDYTDKESCQRNTLEKSCAWLRNNSCDAVSCWTFSDNTSCQSAPSELECTWKVVNPATGYAYCIQKGCGDYTDETSCNSSARTACGWVNNNCTEMACWRYYTESSCRSAQIPCAWSENPPQCLNNNTRITRTPDGVKYTYADEAYPKQFYRTDCYSHNDKKEECMRQPACQWLASGYPTSLSSGERRRGYALGYRVLWIFSNLVFLAIILAVIGYGTWRRVPSLINLGIAFFVLDVVSRYIGFILDLWGYVHISLVFISGGILLLAGGWYIEKWRRRLLEQQNE